MKLGEALSIVGLENHGLDGSTLIRGVECRPAADIGGKAFFVFPEYHDYQRWWEADEIHRAIEGRGAALVVSSFDGLGCLSVADVPVACARLAKAFHGRPDESLPVIGVTGTNGKTTTTQLLYQALRKLEGSAAALGTLGTFLNGELWEEPGYTTDLSVELYRKLAGLKEGGAQAVAMEVSSHALALDRVAALRWKAAVLTNVTRDHLDFHGTLEAYQAAKGLLFSSLEKDALAILPTASLMTPAYVSSTMGQVVTYGSEPWADLKLSNAVVRSSGSTFSVEWKGEKRKVKTDLVGSFQIQNLLAAGATLLGLGYSLEASWRALSNMKEVPGRMEKFILPNGAVAVVDYAHNPDGLEVVLKACREWKPRALHLVFGCGGDRDRGKRALMGGIASQLADRSWITSDNPRSEEPSLIINDISKGFVEGSNWVAMVDRKEAILEALNSAQEGDVVLIAGKGHEDYQLVGDKRLNFSDRTVVKEWIRCQNADA